MGMSTVKSKIVKLFKKYRYMLLIVLVGIVLTMIPSKYTSNDNDSTTQIQQVQEERFSISEQLAMILGKIDGAGEVHVLLSIAAGEETVYQTNTDDTSGSDSTHTKVETVVITNGNREQTGMIRQIKAPVYKGAVVVCQGADSPTVRLAIVNAVSKATGLGSDCICVLKMK